VLVVSKTSLGGLVIVLLLLVLSVATKILSRRRSGDLASKEKQYYNLLKRADGDLASKENIKLCKPFSEKEIGNAVFYTGW